MLQKNSWGYGRTEVDPEGDQDATWAAQRVEKEKDEEEEEEEEEKKTKKREKKKNSQVVKLCLSLRQASQ